MSNYIKQNFEPGQILTAAQLNHIEDGIKNTEELTNIKLDRPQLIEEEIEILSETTVTTAPYFQGGFYAMVSGMISEEEWNPYAGDVITVECNGQIYECVGYWASTGYLAFGNVANCAGSSPDDIGNSEPFGFIPAFTNFIFSSEATTLTIKINGKRKKRKPLEAFYTGLRYDPEKHSFSTNWGAFNDKASAGEYSFYIGTSDSFAEGDYSFAVHGGTTPEAQSAIAFNGGIAAASNSFVAGPMSQAYGNNSLVIGTGNYSTTKNQVVLGNYNEYEPVNASNYGKYAYIFGNGTKAKRSNAHTLDWSGNAWFAGTMEGTGVIVKSSTEGSNKRFMLTVDDNGTISATEITEE